MAARKLQQEVDKCFKKVAEGVAEFESIYEKIEVSNNPAQKEKLEDNLKREIKKLQRLRDQIKTWAASNDIKDKGPLLEHRRLIETQMERFKAVEKAMKTKAYSKEGLSAATKLDPKEQAKIETIDFLMNVVDELEHQIEAVEAERESIQATMKKGKGPTHKTDRIARIDEIIENHKWHQGRLELIRRSLENGNSEAEEVMALKDDINYYLEAGQQDDYPFDDEMYDTLNLQEEEETYGLAQENDKGSSQDAQSTQDEPEPETKPPAVPAKSIRNPVEATAAVARRPSGQLKSPLPTLATLHNPMANVTNGSTTASGMKPASLPTRPAGEGLKYASAAAAAAEKNSLGISPLPPPPGALPVTASMPPLPTTQVKTSATNSPSIATIQAASSDRLTNFPVPSNAGETKASESSGVSTPTPPPSTRKAEKAAARPGRKTPATAEPVESSKVLHTNGVANGAKPAPAEEEESIYHLPAALKDLVDSFEVTKKRSLPVNTPSHVRMMHTSQVHTPSLVDAEAPREYRPDNPYPLASQYPQEPLAIFDDPRLYSRIDPDTLFYVFYYRQGTDQQYYAAKALKDQSWRFHKQYQTWFQRHEEPKSITEEFEQGTYRFFDYESTWMNRRKADFKFVYRFLEDEV